MTEAAKPANCIDCKHHKIVNDRDPDDWFCDDDVAVVCTLSPRKADPHSRFVADKQEYKTITLACRPYNTRKESERPTWCPLP